MKKIVIASACRTAIGKFGGTLANVPAVELGSIVIKEALSRANVAPEQVDHVYMGCVIQAGLGQNVARQAALKAGLPIETPAVTVNVVCGSGLTVADMDLIEANEAFAAQSVAVSQALDFDMSKVNVNGGAIALGHPVGASGARILVTLLYAMKHRGAHKGLATLCIGGGMGCATIVEMD